MLIDGTALTEAERREIRELHARGWTPQRLAEHFDVPLTLVCRLVGEDARRHEWRLAW